jgi:hypothetical protein
VIYDIDTDSYHKSHDLKKKQIFVQDVIKPLDNSMFLNKSKNDFKEVNLQSKFN